MPVATGTGFSAQKLFPQLTINIFQLPFCCQIKSFIENADLGLFLSDSPLG
ncbi:hypothetical protein BTN49_1023 [Candidatus Enterovibrio escicola]|uniref:Uncharacterized protein n=1 Tax=Candidatus Enterovibrio escicola TaxID=1927127 RepID=A0A2A5T4K2_9GAMM|nr:hypothetical protein BTN49_1023 [Candidatus Enterovibrio escacola]